MSPTVAADDRIRSIELEYTHTPTEAVRSSMALSRARTPTAGRLGLWLGTALVVLAIHAGFSMGEEWPVAFIPGGLGIMLLLSPWLTRWSIQRNFRHQPGAHATIRWRINADTLEAWGPFGDATFHWTAIVQVQASKHGYLLFTQPCEAQWLPRNAFASAEDATQFERWIEANRDRIGSHASRPSAGSETTSASTPVPVKIATSAAATARIQEPVTAPSSALVASFVYTADEAARAGDALRRSIPVWMRVAPWFPAMLAVGVIVVIMNHRWDWLQVALLVFVLVLVWGLVRLRLRKGRARAFEESPDADREVRWRIDAERLDVVGAHTDASFRWTALIKVRETADGFLLFQQPRLAQWLPRAAFADPADLAQFRAWVRQHEIDFRKVV